jgi:hypothetical protein
MHPPSAENETHQGESRQGLWAGPTVCVKGRCQPPLPLRFSLRYAPLDPTGPAGRMQLPRGSRWNLDPSMSNGFTAEYH